MTTLRHPVLPARPRPLARTGTLPFWAGYLIAVLAVVSWLALLAWAPSTMAATAASVAPSNLSYPVPGPLFVGQAITPLTPAVTGTVTRWSVSPALPAGLHLDATSGVISGTPTNLTSRDVYTVRAANAAGSTRFRLPLSVRLAPPTALSYVTPPPFVLGVAIAPLSPSVTGRVSSYSVSPALPAGLQLSRRTGVISGTPTVASAPASYVVKASNAAGSTSFALTLSVNGSAPTGLSYVTPAPFVQGVAIAPLAPSVTGLVSGYSVAPALPTGLALEPATGVIAGTPTVVVAAQTYVVTASNAAGASSFNLVLSVLPPPPTALSYPAPALLTQGRVALPITPTVSGLVSGYAVSPPLPAGLSLDPTTGAIQGTPTVLSALASYTVTASNAAGSTQFDLSLAVVPGPVVHLTGSATDANGLPLTYRWRTTDGSLLSAFGPEVDWLLPAGPGLHIAYLLVSNGSGGYTERRVVVSTDAIGTPAIVPPTSALQAPPAPSQQGDYYRSFIQAGMTSTPYFNPTVSGPSGHLVMVAGDSVSIGSGAGAVLTNLRGEFVIPGVLPGTTYSWNCNAANGFGLFGHPATCSSTSGWNTIFDSNITMLDVAITDWYPGGQNPFQTWPWAVGTLKLADGSPCGVNDEFFGLKSVGRATYTDSAGIAVFNTDPNAGVMTLQFGPVDVNDFMDYALPSASLSVGGPTHIRLDCENAAPIINPIPSGLGTGITDLGLSTVAGVTAPTITQIVASHDGTVVATFPAPAVVPPPPADPTPASNINPRASAFLAFKGLDSRLGACQYYKAVGAVQSCDANGFPSGAVSFDDWKRAVKMGPYALPGVPEYTATYINKMDLNLTRNHHSITYGPGQTAAYVCNHLGPKTLFHATQEEIDQVIDDAVAGRNLVACVAMDHTVSPGVNVDAQGVAQPYTRFLIFGPSGELLQSVNLDGRGEKFVPGTCVACHGGDHYAGHFPEDGSGFANIGAHFLPYDTGNFEFSSKPGLTQADQEEAIYQLNQNLLNAGPTVAAQELIAGWYASGTHVLDLNYVPASWQAGTPAQITYYKDIESHYCRSCHVALTEGYNFDHLANYRLPNGSYRSTRTNGFLATSSAQCGPAFYGLPSLEYSMPNSLVTFNRFWALFGDPGSPAAHAACTAAVNVQ